MSHRCLKILNIPLTFHIFLDPEASLCLPIHRIPSSSPSSTLYGSQSPGSRLIVLLVTQNLLQSVFCWCGLEGKPSGIPVTKASFLPDLFPWILVGAYFAPTGDYLSILVHSASLVPRTDQLAHICGSGSWLNYCHQKPSGTASGFWLFPATTGCLQRKLGPWRRPARVWWQEAWCQLPPRLTLSHHFTESLQLSAYPLLPRGASCSGTMTSNIPCGTYWDYDLTAQLTKSPYNSLGTHWVRVNILHVRGYQMTLLAKKIQNAPEKRLCLPKNKPWEFSLFFLVLHKTLVELHWACVGTGVHRKLQYSLEEGGVGPEERDVLQFNWIWGTHLFFFFFFFPKANKNPV